MCSFTPTLDLRRFILFYYKIQTSCHKKTSSTASDAVTSFTLTSGRDRGATCPLLNGPCEPGGSLWTPSAFSSHNRSFFIMSPLDTSL